MNYAATTASINYSPLIFLGLLVSFSAGLLALLVVPPRRQAKYLKPSAKFGVAAVAAGTALVATTFGYSLYSKTQRCTKPSEERGGHAIRGALRVIESGKYIRFQIDGLVLSSATPQAPSECGIRASLAQSVSLHDQAFVEATIVSGAVATLRASP